MTPFDFVKAINSSKDDLFVDSQAERDYNPFIVNRSLSYFHDTVMYANEVNKYSAVMPKQWQFEFLRTAVPKRSRFAKWLKKDIDDNVSLIQQHYNYSASKAVECLSILSKSQVGAIRESRAKGGLTNR